MRSSRRDARLREGICEPGGLCLSSAAYEQVRDRITETFADHGEKTLKNVARPLRVYSVTPSRGAKAVEPDAAEKRSRLPLPDKPAIAVLPFENMSGDPEQEYFSDGISRGHHHRALQAALVLRHRAQFVLHLQGQGRPHEAGRRGARRGLCARRQRAQGRQARAHHRPAQRRGDWKPCLGRALRSRTSRMCSPCRTRSPRRSWPRSSRSSTPRRIFAPSASRPTAWTRGSW